MSSFAVKPATGLFRTEIRAGAATFLTMSYILFLNPAILGQAIVVENGAAQLMTTTALAAAFGSLAMGLIGRFPFALAPGMGLNAYFTYAVVLGQGIPWQTALGAVFFSGLLFFFVSLIGLRQVVLEAIPRQLKIAIGGGIGCFLATIGLVNAGLVVDHPATLVSLGQLSQPGPLIALFGCAVTLVLVARDVKGALIIGILAGTIAAHLFDAPVFNDGTFAGFSQGLIALPVWPTDLFFALDLQAALGLGIFSVIFTFFFVDFFDTAGTLLALSQRAGLEDQKGHMLQPKAAFCIDGLASAVGALLGTSSTTTYIESAAGIQEGGRTGWTAVTVAMLFGLSLFLWPLVSAVPAVATSPALIAIGCLMMSGAGGLDWRDPYQAIPALLTILGMPLTYSITDGLSFGFISWVTIHLLGGRAKQVHWMMGLIAALLAFRLIFMG